MSIKESLAISMPVYVTKPTANGETGAFSLNAWVAFAIFLMVISNIILWNVIGLIQAMRILF